MDIDFAFICDYADISGKINALGIGFNTLYSPTLPLLHPHFYLVAQLRTNITEAGTKNLEVRLIDADGGDVIPPITGTFEISRPEAGTESTGRIEIAFVSVTFPRYGSYSLHLLVQGREMVRIPLRVAQPPPTA